MLQMPWVRDDLEYEDIQRIWQITLLRSVSIFLFTIFFLLKRIRCNLDLLAVFSSKEFKYFYSCMSDESGLVVWRVILEFENNCFSEGYFYKVIRPVEWV